MPRSKKYTGLIGKKLDASKFAPKRLDRLPRMSNEELSRKIDPYLDRSLELALSEGPGCFNYLVNTPTNSIEIYNSVERLREKTKRALEKDVKPGHSDTFLEGIRDLVSRSEDYSKRLTHFYTGPFNDYPLRPNEVYPRREAQYNSNFTSPMRTLKSNKLIYRNLSNYSKDKLKKPPSLVLDARMFFSERFKVTGVYAALNLQGAASLSEKILEEPDFCEELYRRVRSLAEGEKIISQVRERHYHFSSSTKDYNKINLFELSEDKMETLRRLRDKTVDLIEFLFLSGDNESLGLTLPAIDYSFFQVCLAEGLSMESFFSGNFFQDKKPPTSIALVEDLKYLSRALELILFRYTEADKTGFISVPAMLDEFGSLKYIIEVPAKERTELDW